MKPKTIIILVAVYVLVMIFTYGHANRDAWATANLYQKENGFPPVTAFFESALWPFYWSIQFWK
jgi:hypothetical protein